MKKKILIFSAGSASREVFELIQSINKHNDSWEVVGYVDDSPSKIGKKIDEVKVVVETVNAHNPEDSFSDRFINLLQK